jgi:small redox-active disulfide protein 2
MDAKTLHVLGPGCARCKMLAENARAAARELGIPFELFEVTDIEEILKFDVLMTPALVVDGEVRLVGKVLSKDEIKPLLGDERVGG